MWKGERESISSSTSFCGWGDMTCLESPMAQVGKASAYQWRRCKRCGFNSWVRKIPWRRKWQPTPVFLPGKFHRQRSLVATVHEVKKNETRLSTHTHTHSHTLIMAAEVQKPISVDSITWILHLKSTVLRAGCHFWHLLHVMPQPNVRLFATLWNVACQAPVSMDS